MLGVLRNWAARRRDVDPPGDSIDDLRDLEIQEWSRRFGISAEELRHAVAKVGKSTTELARHLRRSA